MIMEIVYNNNINKVPFSELKEGDVFKYGAILCMKIRSFCVCGVIYNAIELDDGEHMDFADEYVEPVKGKFVMD